MTDIIKLINAKTLLQKFQKYGFNLPYYGIEGTIGIKNMSYNKRVGFRITFDDWKTCQDVPAMYDEIESTSCMEIWKISPTYISIGDNNSSNFLFALYYHNDDTDETYWDNNEGRNYSLKKEEGVELIMSY